MKFIKKILNLVLYHILYKILDPIYIFLDKKNNRNIHDLKSLGLVLGMPTSITKFL